MLGSQIVFGFSRIAIRSLSLFCHVILRVLMSRCNHCKRSWHSKVTRVHRTACIRSVTACRYRALVTVWMTVLSSAVPSVRMLDFRFENDTVHRAAANDFPLQAARPAAPCATVCYLALRTSDLLSDHESRLHRNHVLLSAFGKRMSLRYITSSMEKISLPSGTSPITSSQSQVGANIPQSSDFSACVILSVSICLRACATKSAIAGPDS